MGPDFVIDAEVHLLHPEAHHPKFAQGTAEPARKAIYDHKDFPRVAPMLGIDALINSMSMAGIDYAIIMGLAWRDHGILQDNNAYVEQCVRTHPGRLRGLYIPDPSNPGQAAREVAALDKSVFLGVKLIPSWQGVRMDDPALAPLLDVVEKRIMVVMIHIDHMTNTSGEDTPARLLELARRHPNLKVVATHLGGLLCLYGLLPAIRRDMQNVHFVTSVSATMEMVEFAARVNPGNLVFGTDFPFNHCHDQETPLAALRSMDLADQDRRGILAGNARKLLGWP